MSTNYTIQANDRIIRALGVILRDAVENTNEVDNLALTRGEWTLIEEIATGAENI